MTPLPPHPRLRALWERGRRLLGSELAVMGGAMTWVSEHHLVAAISDAGGFGVLACGAMSPAALATEIEATRRLTLAPFGVNLIIMHPALDQLIEVCLDLKVHHVVLAGGVPPARVIQKVRAGDALPICFAPTLAMGRRLVKSGAAGLILEGMEAGGHIGAVSASVLAQEILPEIVEVPVFMAGGIGHGEAIAAYLRMGAAGVQIGTLFVCAEESTAHPAFKQAFIRASARDAQPSVQLDPEFNVIPVRALVNAASRRFVETQLEVIGRYRRGETTHQEATLAIEHFWAGALRRAVVDGDIENGSLMAGQSVGLVRRIQPVAAILADLVERSERALARPDPVPAAPAAAHEPVALS